MIKKFDEFINESLSSSDKKDLDRVWDDFIKSEPFDQYTNQKKADLEDFISDRGSNWIFDRLCDDLIELGWTEDKQVKAGTELFAHWKKKAKEEAYKELLAGR